jgi:O-acetyl-ADP-ribose deacetylase (regulator of RNase III)
MTKTKGNRIVADITQIKQGVIAHPVSLNTECKYIGGYSSTLRKRFGNEAFSGYEATCKNYKNAQKENKSVLLRNALGSVVVDPTPTNSNVFIAHLFCMENADNKNYTNSMAVSICIDKLSQIAAKKFKDFFVYFPYKMASGIYGGSWNMIEEEINSKIKNCKICILPRS